MSLLINLHHANAENMCDYQLFYCQVREEMEETQRAIDDLQWRSDLVNKKIQECLDATKVVMKIQKQTDDQIADLG